MSSLHQHQMSAQSIAGASHGGRPGQALVADKLQDWPAMRRAGIARESGLSLVPNSHRSESSPDRGRMNLVGFLLPVGQGIRPTHKAERVVAARCVSASGVGSRPSGRNRLAHQPIVSRVAAALVHRECLSSSLVSVGIDPNEIGLTHAQIVFAPGAKAND